MSEEISMVAVSPTGSKRQHLLRPGAIIEIISDCAWVVGWARCGRMVSHWERGRFEDGNLCAQCLSRRRK